MLIVRRTDPLTLGELRRAWVPHCLKLYLARVGTAELLLLTREWRHLKEGIRQGLHDTILLGRGALRELALKCSLDLDGHRCPVPFPLWQCHGEGLRHRRQEGETRGESSGDQRP